MILVFIASCVKPRGIREFRYLFVRVIGNGYLLLGLLSVITFTIFHSLGSAPSHSELLKTAVNGGARIYA